MSLKTSFSIILITGLIIWRFYNLANLMIGLPQIGVFFKQMIPPDWGYLDHITQPMLDTIVWQCRYFSWKYCLHSYSVTV